MRKPGIKNLRVDSKESKRMHSALTDRKSVKITINIDSGSLAALRRLSVGSGIAYQRLLNQVLREGLTGRTKMKSRLDRLEREPWLAGITNAWRITRCKTDPILAIPSDSQGSPCPLAQ